MCYLAFVVDFVFTKYQLDSYTFGSLFRQPGLFVLSKRVLFQVSGKANGFTVKYRATFSYHSCSKMFVNLKCLLRFVFFFPYKFCIISGLIPLRLLKSRAQREITFSQTQSLFFLQVNQSIFKRRSLSYQKGKPREAPGKENCCVSDV